MLQLLIGYTNQIDSPHWHLEVIKHWMANQESLTSTSAETWKQLGGDVSTKLTRLEAEFWELNILDIEESTRLQILELAI